MRITNCFVDFSYEKRRRLGMLRFAFAVIIAWNVAASQLSAQVKTKVNAQDGLTYVWIPAGTFQMGCSPDDSNCAPSEKPTRMVTLTKGFWIGQTLVTLEAYKKLVGTNPHGYDGDRFPVDSASWDDAESYCQRTGMRLPTEAEWEYAARGGSTTATYGPVDQIAWYGANSGGKAHEVGQKQPNRYGLYDMLGNIWEWVADWYGSYDRAGTENPKGPPGDRVLRSAKVLRGGMWVSAARDIRVSYRYALRPDVRDRFTGFRCAGD